LCIVIAVAISDATYKLGVAAGGTALVAMIWLLRFCGSVTIAPKPPPPTGPTGTARDLISKANAQQPMYEQGLREDAHTADIALPSMAEMSRKLADRADDVTHPLVVGQPLELAGLKLTLQAVGDALQLEVTNTLTLPVAYRVDTQVSLGSICKDAPPLPFDAMVLRAGASETRTECLNRPDIITKVTHVETVELPPLSAYYVDMVSPQLVGIEERISRGHRPTGRSCSSALPQLVVNGIETHQIKWRDLIDFYARHSCERYLFPASYRAFTQDAEVALPAVDSRM
jgi:hypothetical protein